MNNLIEVIRQKQKQQGLTDEALSKLLGIDRSTWSYIKSGKRNPGLKFFTAVANQFPELKTLIDAEIYDSSSLKPHQTPPEPRQGGLRWRINILRRWFRRFTFKKRTKSKSSP